MAAKALARIHIHTHTYTLISMDLSSDFSQLRDSTTSLTLWLSTFCIWHPRSRHDFRNMINCSPLPPSRYFSVSLSLSLSLTHWLCVYIWCETWRRDGRNDSLVFFRLTWKIAARRSRAPLFPPFFSSEVFIPTWARMKNWFHSLSLTLRARGHEERERRAHLFARCTAEGVGVVYVRRGKEPFSSGTVR